MEVKDIEMDRIHLSACNTRKDLQAGIEDSGTDDLANSIRERGLLSPITVRKGIEKIPGIVTYELIAGKRRYLACQILGWKTIPAIIRDVGDDMCCTIISLIENLHRADLNPMDKARAFQQIYQRYNDYNRVSKETGIGLYTIRRYLDLLNLAPPIQKTLEEVRKTRDGPAGIGTLSTLSKTFPQEQHVEALEKIGGFNQDIQVEVIKKSEGNMVKLEELREMAVDGAFNIYMCKGFHQCQYIPDELKSAIEEMVNEFEKDENVVKNGTYIPGCFRRLLKEEFERLEKDENIMSFKKSIRKLILYESEDENKDKDYDIEKIAISEGQSLIKQDENVAIVK